MLRSRRHCFGIVSEEVEVHVAASNLILEIHVGSYSSCSQFHIDVAQGCGLDNNPHVCKCLSWSPNNVYDEHGLLADSAEDIAP